MKFLTRSSYTALRLSLGVLGVLLCAWLLASLIDLSWASHVGDRKTESASDRHLSAIRENRFRPGPYRPAGVP